MTGVRGGSEKRTRGSRGPRDQELVSLLRAGDERAFAELVETFQGRLVRLAHSFCRNEAVIEEAVQETWLAVIKGIKGFEGRAPLRSWIFSILVNHARRLAVREQKLAEPWRYNPHVPSPDADAVDADIEGEEREPGMGLSGRWETPPTPWGLEDPESAMLSRETLSVIEEALATLPEAQRQVVLLRDVEGLGAEEVCNILRVSGTNERVLLHRARARVRRALDAYLKQDTRGTDRTGQRKARPG